MNANTVKQSDSLDYDAVSGSMYDTLSRSSGRVPRTTARKGHRTRKSRRLKLEGPFRQIIGVVLILLFASTADACKVPVFRYALERWPADRYEIVALIDGEPTGDAADALTSLRSLAEPGVNVVTRIVDLATLSDAELWSVEGLESTEQTPLLQVFYPERDGQRKLCWSGALTIANVNAWIDSPLRNNIIREIQTGASAVWVLVDGPDEHQNNALRAELDAALREASAAISIPEGVIRREDAAQYLRDHPAASMDDVLRCDIPLSIKFTIERLRSDDENEVAFRAMVDGWTETVEAPFVFPVFGRGRMIEPLSAADFSASSITAACRYLVGECSCSVKALNPGVDLILKTDWQQTLGDQIVMVQSVSQNEPLEVSIPAGKPETAEATAADATVDGDQDDGKIWVLVVMALGALAFTMKLRMGMKAE
ncbi:hypothetical protein Enr13x_06210 [Stieleria neptunia]|uniref:Uncharacterized protein n=1 Tax=Stieleria neptunia TaxID=2527979 RepID=A0A518HIV5_9BACT|nr:hypothetical protein [Stieleria neptunia]QDV40785.1 hypothetical protein Enr13x_06210 [Stieleria neptunia]